MNSFCEICGKMPAIETHHLIFGRGMRNLCEEDKGGGLTIKVCMRCHRTIHDNGTAGALSKMLGQALWERWYIGDFGDADSTLRCARENFIERYGRSYL